MRIGRNLTVQEVYNIVNEYNSTYELTETQINNIIAHDQGAIGCLSYLLGIDSNKVPVVSLYTEDKTVPNGAYYAIPWTEVKKDNLNAWLISSPTEINLVYSGLYEVTLVVEWGHNNVGRRRCLLGNNCFPLLDCDKADLADAVNVQLLTGLVSVNATSPFKFWVQQTSGGDLMINYAYCIVYRRAFIPYFG